MDVINHSLDNYHALVASLVATKPYDEAMYWAVGCRTFADFCATGDGQAAVLRHHGLADGMRVYDLGCGSGRTAQALVRANWKGEYTGADIVQKLVDYLMAHCPGYRAVVNTNLNIAAPDASLDMVFHWSVFTHLFIEESFIYLQDIHRALKPGGRLVFSFMELENEKHVRILRERIAIFKARKNFGHLDTFLHRDWIRSWAAEIGFAAPRFTDGSDTSHHPAFWQSLVAMDKPG